MTKFYLSLRPHMHYPLFIIFVCISILCALLFFRSSEPLFMDAKIVSFAWRRTFIVQNISKLYRSSARISLSSTYYLYAGCSSFRWAETEYFFCRRLFTGMVKHRVTKIYLKYVECTVRNDHLYSSLLVGDTLTNFIKNLNLAFTLWGIELVLLFFTSWDQNWG